MAQLKLASGHPQGLMTLFFSEMWERFCYYGMRVLLTLYLVKSLLKGDAEASLIYGAYTALIYAQRLFLVGGWRIVLRYRYAILLGAVLMAIGEFLILGARKNSCSWAWAPRLLETAISRPTSRPSLASCAKTTILAEIPGSPFSTSELTSVPYWRRRWWHMLAKKLVSDGDLVWLGLACSPVSSFSGLAEKITGHTRFGHFRSGHETGGPIEIVSSHFPSTCSHSTFCYVLISQNDLMSYLLTALFVIVAFSLIQGGFKESKVWGQRMIALVIFMLTNIVFGPVLSKRGRH